MILRKLTRKVIRKLIQCQILFVHGGVPHELRTQFTVNELELGDLDKAVFHEDPTGAEAARLRFERGDRCFFVSEDGKIAAYAWVAIRQRIRFPFVGQYFHLDSESPYIYDCYTSTMFRGKNMYRDLMQYICILFRGSQVFIACRSHNQPSIHGIKKAGFQEYKRFYRVDILLLSLKFKSAGRRDPAGSLFQGAAGRS